MIVTAALLTMIGVGVAFATGLYFMRVKETKEKNKPKEIDPADVVRRIEETEKQYWDRVFLDMSKPKE